MLKHLFGIICIVAVMVAIVTVMPNSAQSAGAGCCMKRETIDPSSWWVKIKEDVNACKRLNQREDNNDNILESKGLYRWSLKC